VKVTPKKHGGLLGAIDLAWDAANGIPLRVGLYPKGSSSPVVELKATNIHFGPVDSSAFGISPPASAHVVDIERPNKTDESNRFTPDVMVLAGRKLQTAWKTPDGSVAVYGKGLDAIWVVRHAAAARHERSKIQLGTAAIDGVTADVLETPLGTAVQWSKNGVTTIVAGSVTRDVAERAARGL
jgi:hypothetical protein